MKICQICNQPKSSEEYKSEHHHCKVCISCIKEKHKQVARVYGRTDRKRENQYLKRYGITLQDYDNLLIKQQNCCAICNTHIANLSTRLHVDHCHKTKKVRGLLCFNCNQGIGRFKDSLEIIEKAKDYLIMHREL